VDNEHVGCLSKEFDILDVGPLIAAVATEVRDFVSVEHRLQAVVYISLVLDLKREGVEVVRLDGCVPTAFADALLNLASLEDILAEELLGSWSQSVLQLIEEEVEELLGVALDGCVGWVALKVLV